MMTREEYVIGSDGMTYRKVKSYAKDKYGFLNLYMKLFTTSMRGKWDLVYVDLFSSNGKCIIEGTGEEINGSALIALDYPFSRFIFNDVKEERIEELRIRVQNSNTRIFHNCLFTTGDADQCLQELFNSKHIGKRSDLLLIFSDPNDLAPSFETIQFISSHLRADLFFHLSYGIDLKRNLSTYIKQRPSKLDRFLGDEEWRSIQNITTKNIVAHYFRKLRNLGYHMIDINEEFPIPTMFSIMGKKKVLLYYLFIVSKNKLGYKFGQIVHTYGKSQLSFFD